MTGSTSSRHEKEIITKEDNAMDLHQKEMKDLVKWSKYSKRRKRKAQNKGIRKSKQSIGKEKKKKDRR